MDVATRNTRYEALDGVRAFSAIGIVVMHVLANGNFHLSGFLFETIIPSFTNLVFLFMIISAFSMCCGYYERFRENKISLDHFYQKRFAKILPFFGFLSVLEIVINPSRKALVELFANLTLCFGFLPNAGDISVIGVGWFLGIIFVFYISFPFYCYLIGTKRRAWFILVLTYLFRVICADYFGITRTNILCDAVYLVCGGLIYLYRENLFEFSRSHRIISGAMVISFVIVYYFASGYVWATLCLYGSIVIFALGASHKGILWNRYTKFLSTISMEIYLGHMVCFRVIERAGLIRLIENDLANFALTTTLTFAGAIVLAVAVRWGFLKIGNAVRKAQFMNAIR